MQIDHPREQCKNDRCTCEVKPGGEYCSEYCRNAVEFTDDVPRDETDRGGCGCGHAECKPR